MMPYDLERPGGLRRIVLGYLATILVLSLVGLLVVWISEGSGVVHCADQDPWTGRPVGCELPQ